MASSAEIRKRKPSKAASSSSSSTSRRKPASAPPRPWWGDGASPTEIWPGVTIEIPAVWSAKRERWESPDGLYYFDMAEADRACEFFPTYLTHHKGEFAGKPFPLLEYQSKLLVRPLFGWARADGGLRRFRKVFCAVPKGNGKSALISGIGLYLLLCDNEPGAEIYAAAADRKQASIVFDTAKAMVEDSPDIDGDGVPDLHSMCEVYARSIAVPATRSAYQVLSADVRTKHGFNVHGLMFDELHTQPNRMLYDTLYKGMGKRRQPVLFMISTAGDDEESICMEEWEYAKNRINGIIEDDTYLPVVFEATPEDDWTDPAVWKRVNPGYGVTIKSDYLLAECQAAVNEPRKRNSFLQLHTNRWTAGAGGWIPLEWWDACPGLDVESFARLPRACGLDMAQKIDLVAFSVVFRHPLQAGVEPTDVKLVVVQDDDQVAHVPFTLNFEISVIPFYWIPEETLRQRERESRIPYSTWLEAGLLRVTEGVVIDYEQIYKDIVTEIMPRYNLKGCELGFDPAFATDLAQRLERAHLRPVEIPQNYQGLSEVSQVFEGLVKAKRVHHDGHRILRWNVECCAVKEDASGRIRPVKPGRRKLHRKIDGVVALLDGLHRLMDFQGQDAGGSVLDRRGPIIIGAEEYDERLSAAPAAGGCGCGHARELHRQDGLRGTTPCLECGCWDFAATEGTHEGAP